MSDALHLILHLSSSDSPLTSESLSEILKTNPVVIRRLLSGLREAGIVSSGKGHGGGWSIQGDVHRISLGQVYRALGSPELFVFDSRTERPNCLIEKSVNAALDDARAEAESILLRRLDRVTLADLLQEARAHLSHSKKHSHHPHSPQGEK